jgi:steroid delta-isomerase
MSDVHPAITAAQNSWRCVMARDREAWFDLLADDVRIEDPIGVAPTNPTGKGFQGKAEAQQFWEANIGRTESIVITAERSFAAGNESAHVLTLVNRFANGVAMTVRGIFTYTIDDHGKINALRGYWSLAEAEVENPG